MQGAACSFPNLTEVVLPPRYPTRQPHRGPAPTSTVSVKDHRRWRDVRTCSQPTPICLGASHGRFADARHPSGTTGVEHGHASSRRQVLRLHTPPAAASLIVGRALRVCPTIQRGFDNQPMAKSTCQSARFSHDVFLEQELMGGNFRSRSRRLNSPWLQQARAPKSEYCRAGVDNECPRASPEPPCRHPARPFNRYHTAKRSSGTLAPALSRCCRCRRPCRLMMMLGITSLGLGPPTPASRAQLPYARAWQPALTRCIWPCIAAACIT